MNPKPESSSSGFYSRIEALLPCSATSILIHTVLFFVANLTLRGCEESVPYQVGEADFHEVSLVTLTDELHNNTQASTTNPAQGSMKQSAEAEAESLVTGKAFSKEAPSLDQLLNPTIATSDSMKELQSPLDSASIIGSGKPFVAAARSPIEKVAQTQSSKGGKTAARTPTLGLGETAFMTVVGAGDSFVYLIDVSSSMKARNGKALNLAKSQLKNSLRHLKNSQEFQVLFYNLDVEAIRLRSQESQSMYRATRLNIQLAESAIDSVISWGGTEHINALERGLKLGPDVIYFLTDGDDSQISASALRRLQSLNRIGTQIHVIEFASGPIESRRRSKLQKLALDFHGKYVRYRVDQ